MSATVTSKGQVTIPKRVCDLLGIGPGSVVDFEGAEAESLLMALDLVGIAVSTGAACAAGAVEPSHVLRGMGLPMRRVQGSLRFSLGRSTTEAASPRPRAAKSLRIR